MTPHRIKSNITKQTRAILIYNQRKRDKFPPTPPPPPSPPPPPPPPFSLHPFIIASTYFSFLCSIWMCYYIDLPEKYFSSLSNYHWLLLIICLDLTAMKIREKRVKKREQKQQSNTNYKLICHVDFSLAQTARIRWLSDWWKPAMGSMERHMQMSLVAAHQRSKYFQSVMID